MKKIILLITGFILILELTSCATIVGGQVTESQRRKPLPGEQSRQIRVGALIADAVFFGGLGILIDFATGAIYKPVEIKKIKNNNNSNNYLNQ
ncbi:MAG: hypothetical protein ACO22Y_02525 [Sediminibacterium sp.]|jgi:hypothetical protein